MPDPVIYLVRHGMHDWLRPGTDRFAGTLPGIALNDQGRAEARRVHEVLKPTLLNWVASSPLQRATETAAIIVEGRGISVTVDERLTEWRCLPWEGMAIDEIRARYPDAWQMWHVDPTRLQLPDTEPLVGVADRLEAAFRDWSARGGTGLFVSHRDPLEALLCRLIGMPLERIRAFDLATGSLSKCRQSSYGVVIESIDQVAPLR